MKYEWFQDLCLKDMLFGMDDLQMKKLYHQIRLWKVKNNFAMFELDLSQELLSEFLFRQKMFKVTASLQSFLNLFTSHHELYILMLFVNGTFACIEWL